MYLYNVNFLPVTAGQDPPTLLVTTNPFRLPKAGPILRDFAARWKDAIEDMHREVSKSFAHAACGRDVLQV